MDLDFRQLVSARYGISAEKFERKLFQKCLFRHALPFVWLLEKCDPDFFREDLEMLRDVASARTTDEVICEINRFFGRNARDKSFIRTGLYLRVSGKRVLRFYRKMIRTSNVRSSEPESVAKTAFPA